MKKQTFYTVLIPLINKILTNQEELNFNHKTINLSENFVSSIQDFKKGEQSVYILSCIYSFLNNLNKKKRVDLSKVFMDNNHILISFLITQEIQKNNAINIEDSGREMHLLLLNYLSKKEFDHRLIYTLFFYLENLFLIEKEDQKISLETYNKIIEVNSRARNKKDIFNTFI